METINYALIIVTSEFHILPSNSPITPQTCLKCSHITLMQTQSARTLNVFQTVSEQQLKRLITKTKPTSCQLNPIPTQPLIESLGILERHITAMTDAFLSSGEVPD